MLSKKILITGGAGYVGSMLVPSLLDDGYEVTVFDLCIYGDDVLDSHPKLRLVKGDIRDIGLFRAAVEGHDTVIHLACISNDPSFELNPNLGRAINLVAFRPLVEEAVQAGVQKFIYASSSSVYGVKSEANVTEDMQLEPLTDYSIYKAECETILNEYCSDNFTTVILRPATVCGYARRQRLDVVVNILSNLAYHKREISIYGGDQLRPNINIYDMVRAYKSVLIADKNLISGEVFNVGFENHSVKKIGKIVAEVFGSDINLKYVETDDIRSYHISSEKFSRVLGFEPKYSIQHAAETLKYAFENKLLDDPLGNEMYFNIKRMQNISME